MHFKEDKREMLFLVTDGVCSQRTTSVATLGWLASEIELNFDAFMNMHRSPSLTPLEQFNYLAAYYRDMYFCSLTLKPEVRFLRSAKAFGKTIVSTRLNDQIYDFYRDVFGYFKRDMPQSAVVVGTKPVNTGKAEITRIDAYCYPEIYYRKALGLASDTPTDQLQKMKEDGISRIYAVYCDDSDISRLVELGFDVKIVDKIRADDTYGKVTTRIADRWIDRARAIAFGNHTVVSYWAPRFLREDRLALWEDDEWIPFAKIVSKYAKIVKNPILFGSQIGLHEKIPLMCDDWDVEIAKYDLTIILTGPGGQLPNKDLAKMPIDWLSNVKAPWNPSNELSDDELSEKAEQGGIAICFMSYCADFGHISAAPGLFDLVAATNAKYGISFPATWYEYWSEFLEEIYLPKEAGGLSPLIEPLCSSAGEGVSTEAEGYNSKEFLEKHLKIAKEKIKERVGENLVPIGYYSSKDACPYYLHGSGEPQFEAVKNAGFDYYITYKNEANPPVVGIPKIVYEDGDFIAINQQVTHWTTTPFRDVTRWEWRLSRWGVPGWAIIVVDVILRPYGHIYTVNDMWRAITYAQTGGVSKKLFLAKPHEVARYARILKKKGILPYELAKPYSELPSPPYPEL